MKLGITSDTHGNVAAWRLARERYFADADAIVHAGDVLYHGPRNPLVDGYDAAALVREINDCPTPLLMAMGNCDSAVDTDVLDVPLATPYLFAVIGRYRIVVVHGLGYESMREKSALATRLKANLFISGHTHIGGLEQRDGVIYLNPGSPSLSKRSDGRQTVATLTDGTLRLLDLHTGEVLQSIEAP